jgi:glycosyltransferase involved in cell wall biosynthesis
VPNSDHHYLFFVRDELPKPEAHLIQPVQCANAAANLGYAAWLVYLDRRSNAWQLQRWIRPRPRPVGADFARFFNIQPQLPGLTLAMPWPIDRIKHKLTNSSTIACKYYWPVCLRSATALVHTRDWNFAKAALKSQIPVIFECHHLDPQPFEPEFAHSPWLQAVVTVIDTVQANIVERGIPAEKVHVVPNGLNQNFLQRDPEAATRWRQRLLADNYQKLAVYAGALYPFKGIDLILDIAPQFPRVKFALAGGPAEQQAHYRQMIQARHLDNVELVGFLAQQDLAHLLQGADVLLHPHLLGPASTFTSPLKLFDYIAAGPPIVASRIPSLVGPPFAELIDSWCAPDQPRAFVECLRELLTREDRPPAGFTRDARVLQPFSWEARIETILAKVDPQYRPPRDTIPGTANPRTLEEQPL